LSTCNAFYRDPANARYAMADANEYCSCLGEKLQFSMGREEEACCAAGELRSAGRGALFSCRIPAPC
jgi:hypothetical protein